MGWVALIFAGIAALVFLIWKSHAAAEPYVSSEIPADTGRPYEAMPDQVLAAPEPTGTFTGGASVGSVPATRGIAKLAAAIQKFEGWYPGTPSYRNKNPGNLRSGARQIGTEGGYAKYRSFADGWADLIDLLKKRANQHPDWTLLDLFNSYAPASDGNDPNTYAKYVAQQTGLNVNMTLGELA